MQLERLADICGEAEFKASRASSLLLKLPKQKRLVSELMQWGIVDIDGVCLAAHTANRFSPLGR